MCPRPAQLRQGCELGVANAVRNLRRELLAARSCCSGVNA